MPQCQTKDLHRLVTPAGACSGFAIGAGGQNPFDLSIWETADAEPTELWNLETGADQAFYSLAVEPARRALATMETSSPLN